MSELQSIKAKLDQGKSLFGIWNIICDPMLIEAAASAGLDFQIFDFEHGTFDISKLHPCILAAERHLCCPLVRIPKDDAHLVQRCLDLGAHGIIFPQIRNVNEALTCLNHTFLPPVGDKGHNPFTRSSLFTSKTSLFFSGKINGIIIENKEGYEQLEHILKIPALDLIYIGVYDLSVDLGYQNQLNHPKLKSMISKIIQSTLKAHKHVGMMVHSSKDVAYYFEMGVQFFVYQVDTKIYFDKISMLLETTKEILNPK